MNSSSDLITIKLYYTDSLMPCLLFHKFSLLLSLVRQDCLKTRLANRTSHAVTVVASSVSSLLLTLYLVMPSRPFRLHQCNGKPNGNV